MNINPSNQQRGFIVMTSMVFLIIITLLCLHMLEDSLIQMKMNDNFYYHDKLFYLAESALAEAEEQVANSGITTRDLAELDSEQDWLAAGAVIHLQEVVARFSSQKLQTICYKHTQGGEQWIAFFRITVWISEQKMASPLLLQSTYTRIALKPEHVSQDCLSTMAPTLGRQSWLQLP